MSAATAEASYAAYIEHLQVCAVCRASGTACAEGDALRVIHREAKRAAWPECRCPAHSRSEGTGWAATAPLSA